MRDSHQFALLREMIPASRTRSLVPQVRPHHGFWRGKAAGLLRRSDSNRSLAGNGPVSICCAPFSTAAAHAPYQNDRGMRRCPEHSTPAMIGRSPGVPVIRYGPIPCRDVGCRCATTRVSSPTLSSSGAAIPLRLSRSPEAALIETRMATGAPREHRTYLPPRPR